MVTALKGDDVNIQVSILDFVNDPDQVSDWSPVIEEAMRTGGKGGAIYFPGAREYVIQSPVYLEQSQVFQIDAAAKLVGRNMSVSGAPSLFIIRGQGDWVFEGVGGKARMEVEGENGAVFNFREIPGDHYPNIEMRRLHLAGPRGVDGLSELVAGRRYQPDNGSLGDLVVVDCHFENTDMGIGHARGTLRSLRVENCMFNGRPRMGLHITSPITNGAIVRGNQFWDMGVRGISLGGGIANMIDDGAVEHLPVVTVHDNQIIGGGDQASENTGYILGIIVYGNSISIQGNIVRDFNRGEPVPGERVGHHFLMKDGSWHRGPWVSEDGKPRRRLAGAAIYAKARHGIIANNVCTNSGWRSVIEVKTGGREPYFMVANNVVDGRSLSIEDSFGFEPNVAKAIWINNLVYNMPNMAFKVSNRMQGAFINNVIYDSRIGFQISDAVHENPELIANNHFVNVEIPVVGITGKRLTAHVTPPMPVRVPSVDALPAISEKDRGRLAVVSQGSEDVLYMAKRKGDDYQWVPVMTDTEEAISRKSESVAVDTGLDHQKWTVVGDNLVVNPNLESSKSSKDSSDSLTTPDQWTFFANPSTVAKEYPGISGVRNVPGNGETKSWFVGGDQPVSFNWILQQSVKVNPAATYRVVCKAARNNAKSKLSLIVDANGSPLRSVSADRVAEWEEMEIYFTAPQDVDSVRLRLHGTRSGEGSEIVVQEVSIYRVES